MDQKKIGIFLATCRKEKNLTQAELASKLGVTDKAVSKWENGRCMPDLSLLETYLDVLDLTFNEFLSGQRLTETEYPKKAEENLRSMAAGIPFSLQEKIRYFKRKWKRDHLAELILEPLFLLALLVTGLIFYEGLYLVAVVASPLWVILQNNRMMAYVEKRAYRDPTSHQ